MRIGRIKNKIIGKINELKTNNSCSELAEKYDFNGYKRIYHVHIRKTGGTSLNNMFLKLSGKNSSDLYEGLVSTPEHRLNVSDKIYVGWNKALINKGDYFYAFSHIPYHKLNLKQDTFTFTCFRDPVKRIVSHYYMLVDWVNDGVNHPCIATEGKWLGKSFCDFFNNMPKEHLFNQIYMFSTDFNVDQAQDMLNNVSHIMFTEKFDSGVEELNRKLGIDLESIHIRKSTRENVIKQSELDDLRDVLEIEYRFLSDVSKGV